MSSLWSFLQLTCIALIVSWSVEFSIDEKSPQIISMGKSDHFGYKVLHYKSQTEKWIVASAPLGNNGTGKVYKCTGNKCDPLELQASDSIRSIGMSMAAKSKSPALMVCSPELIHECDTNSYLNGICFEFNENLNLVSNITPSFQECTKRKIDLVFLLDGSESLKKEDFEKNKDFITRVMNILSNTSIQFAAVQFSNTPRTVFNFTAYKEGRAEKLLREEHHLRGLANTYGGMNHILQEILTPAAGANEDATQVLVIITTGKPTDVDSYDIVETIDKKRIIRYVIMVKNYIANIKSLASEENNIFNISDYSGLTAILDKLQAKIYNIEGTDNKLGRKFTKELSQSGFSAVYLEDTLVLGSVGSNDWRGSLFESASSAPAKEILDPNMEEDSYMGYSVTVGKKNGKKVYFSGAPRYKHTGQVQVFYKTNENWTVQHRENGEQIGSYFGAELCALDLDSDGDIDFLLVGAPLYHEPQKEGRMSVYRLNEMLTLSISLTISGLSQGRFASSISTIHDLNGDGLIDVAVGAPLENDHRGAIYIHLGDRNTGLRPHFSQHIMGQTFSPELRFFGLSVDGDTDQGLVKIVVGSQGNIVLLKSRPVVNVTAQLDFSPSEIASDLFSCLAEKRAVHSVTTLKICFSATLNSKGVSGSFKINVAYHLDLDIRRQRSRAQLSENGTRILQSFLELNHTATCINHSIYMPNCVEDTRSPVVIRFNFSQSESKQNSPSAVLNTDCKTVELVEVPFQKNCKNDTCISDLKLNFDFSSSTLLVIDQKYFNITLDLFNVGDDSYNTSLLFHYPSGLSFSKMQVEKNTRKTLISCTGIEDRTDRTVCSVSHPVYPSQTNATFRSSFRISSMFPWNETMEITIKANSDNGRLSNMLLTKTLPVQLAVDLVVKALHEDSVTYHNFSLYETEPKMVEHIFEVKNVGSTSLPLKVTFTYKTKLEYNFEMSDCNISHQGSFKCSKVGNAKPKANAAEGNVPVVVKWKAGKGKDCKDHCEMIQCNFFSNKSQSVQFKLSGKVAFLRHEEYKQNLSFYSNSFEANFVSKVKLNYDTQRYVQITSTSGDQNDPPRFHEAEITTRTELIIPPNRAFIISVGAGGGFFLLLLIILILYWLGFFKRNRIIEELKNEDQYEKEEQNGPEEKELSQLPEKENDSQAGIKSAT